MTAEIKLAEKELPVLDDSAMQIQPLQIPLPAPQIRGDLFPRIEKAYLVGEAAPAFAKTLEGAADYALCGDIERATAAAFRDAAAKGGEAVVLLSPACASFDQFPDFEVRGDAFRGAVQGLLDQPLKGATG